MYYLTISSSVVGVQCCSKCCDQESFGEGFLRARTSCPPEHRSADGAGTGSPVEQVVPLGTARSNTARPTRSLRRRNAQLAPEMLGQVSALLCMGVVSVCITDQ